MRLTDLMTELADSFQDQKGAGRYPCRCCIDRCRASGLTRHQPSKSELSHRSRNRFGPS